MLQTFHLFYLSDRYTIPHTKAGQAYQSLITSIKLSIYLLITQNNFFNKLMHKICKEGNIYNTKKTVTQTQLKNMDGCLFVTILIFNDFRKTNALFDTPIDKHTCFKHHWIEMALWKTQKDNFKLFSTCISTYTDLGTLYIYKKKPLKMTFHDPKFLTCLW